MAVTIDQLVTDPEARLGVAIRAGRTGLERTLDVPRIQKPGLALAGYSEQLHQGRLLCLGGTEIEYLGSISAEARSLALATIMAANPACIVITRGLEPPEELTRVCDDAGISLLVSQLSSPDFIGLVTRYLQEQMAPATSIHGVLLDVLGVGILLMGKSGIGKSEVALDLVVRGHRLVADDIVNIRQSGALYGSGSGIIRHHMEIRGLGIINIKDLFGISAVRDAKKIELVIELAEWDVNEEYDRLGLDEPTLTILDAELPIIRLPVRPGRSIATIVEVAARNQLLKFQGHHSAREFQDRLNRAIADARPISYDIEQIE